MIPAARERWMQVSEMAGNPSSLHTAGRSVRQVVEEARESIAADLRTRPSAVIFTSGGTESDNLAVKGLFWQRRDRLGQPARVLASSIEHHAVLDPVAWLGTHEGASIEWLGVDAQGRVSPDEIEDLLRAGDVALCTVMWANNEVGTIEPVGRIAELCREAGVPFHTDAVQAVGQIPVNLSEIAAHAVTISSHKIGGPFGVGALILDPSLTLTPIMHGGGQERDIRSGTFDAPAIAAFAVALHHAVTGQADHAAHVRELRDQLVAAVLAAVPGTVLNGTSLDGAGLDSASLNGASRLPGNAHFSFPGCEGDALLMLLDAAGIDCSTGSACTAGIPEPSHVLLAMGVDEPTARASLRFSLGRATTSADIDAVVRALPSAVNRAARAGKLTARTRS
ncbi:MAG: aminotransferase class V-fold PLP-dependent enzyme [Actinobacteria bacterium]|nr:aminotransferase class V-fold PLP-dependent enzyme [Actinomycetota bacterium]